MSGPFAFLAPLALMTGSVDTERNLEDRSMQFANTLVTAYTCDLLGYGVDFIGIVDRGHETREAMIASGIDPDTAMDRMQADVRSVRARFNSTYGSAILASRWAIFDSDPTSHGPQGRYMKTFAKRCERLAKNTDTARFFAKPEQRVSGADLSRRLRDMLVLARHGE